MLLTFITKKKQKKPKRKSDRDGHVIIVIKKDLYERACGDIVEAKLHQDPVYMLIHKLDQRLTEVMRFFKKQTSNNDAWETTKQEIQSGYNTTMAQLELSTRNATSATHHKKRHELARLETIKHAKQAIESLFNGFKDALNSIHKEGKPYPAWLENNMQSIPCDVAFIPSYKRVKDYIHRLSERFKHTMRHEGLSVSHEIAKNQSINEIRAACMKIYDKLQTGEISPVIFFTKNDDKLVAIYACKINLFLESNEGDLTEVHSTEGNSVLRFPYHLENPSDIRKYSYLEYPKKPLHHEIMAALKKQFEPLQDEGGHHQYEAMIKALDLH